MVKAPVCESWQVTSQHCACLLYTSLWFQAVLICGYFGAEKVGVVTVVTRGSCRIGESRLLDSLCALRLVIVAVYIFAVLQVDLLAVVAARWRLVSTEHNNV